MKTEGTASVRRGLRVAPSSCFVASTTSRCSQHPVARRRLPSLPNSRAPPPAPPILLLRDFVLSATPEVVASATNDDDGAVLLFGSTGAVGSLVLQKLLESGKNVVAAVSSAEKLHEMSLEGMVGKLKVIEGVDLLQTESLNAALFEGVSQVLICTGPRIGSRFDFYKEPDQNIFAVDSKGVENVTAAAERFLKPFEKTDLHTIQLTPEMQWTSLGDNILGGSSSSRISPSKEKGVRFEGTLVKMTEGPEVGYAFVTQWSSEMQVDCHEADGLHFSVKGDGRSYFLQLQTSDAETNEFNYFIAPFDTVKDCWTHVSLRFHEFRLAKNGAAGTEKILGPSTITKIGLMCANTGPDALPVRNSPEGDFAVEIDSLHSFRDVRPQVVLLSSAAVERSARVGEDFEKRQEQIPIVRLNPGGTLNHKYEGENIVRRSSLPYSIVRPTQLIQPHVEKRGLEPDLLEVGQGDTLAGRIRCVEVADVLLQCLDRPETAFTTFEVRRYPAPEAKGKAMTEFHYLQLFSKLKQDRERAKIGVPPFAKPIPVDSPSELGGRKWSPPREGMIESVQQQQAAMHAKRDKELIGQK